jgi:alpha,alpha-trehalase
MNQKKSPIILSRTDYDAVIFDMDGVVTKTAKVHASAWKALFDEYLQRTRGEWKPFDADADYRRYVDGKPRYEGVKSFLASRGITLPQGSPEDDPDEETVCGLGNRKNRFFHDRLKKDGVEIYAPGVRLVKKLNRAEFKTAVVSSSKNCADVLEAAGISNLFHTRVDGVESEKLGLKGKPDPDIFVEAARRLGAEPHRSVVVEDAIAGVQSGKSGNFGCVIGVDRTGHAQELRENGADVVVTSLSKIDIDAASPASLRPALGAVDEIRKKAQNKKVAVFLDYDGTLTPIVDSPDRAVLSERMRRTVAELAEICTVGVISGRDLRDVQKMVGIEGIFYAGSHGFDIAGPGGRQKEFQPATDFLPPLEEAEALLKGKLKGIEGTLLERKKFSIAVHYRKVREAEVGRVEEAVDQVLSQFDRLRKSHGKKVYELQPKIDWHKGKALLWVLDALDLNAPDVLPFYIGDDTTDEDAFEAIRDRGIGILVTEEPRASHATYALKAPAEVEAFLEALKEMIPQ